MAKKVLIKKVVIINKFFKRVKVFDKSWVDNKTLY